MRSPDGAARVLILGGTAEARALASALQASGVDVVSSLAGRLVAPRLPSGEVRIGGFGGEQALARWISENGIVAVVDATHPFAERISASALAACQSVGVPLARLERPAWEPHMDDRWHVVDDVSAAALLVPQLGRRVFLTIGRQHLDAFAEIDAAWFLIRCIEPPAPPLPPLHEVVLDRGPFTLDGELALLDRHQIDLLVTRDSGGLATQPKLEAARIRRLPVLVIRRPRLHPQPEEPVENASPVPGGHDGGTLGGVPAHPAWNGTQAVRTVPDPAGALAWVRATLAQAHPTGDYRPAGSESNSLDPCSRRLES